MIEFPVPTIVPPQEPVYHTQLAAPFKLPPITDKVTAEPAHVFAGIGEIVGAVAFVGSQVALSTVIEPIKYLALNKVPAGKSPAYPTF
jgi:hypothetical protein